MAVLHSPDELKPLVRAITHLSALRPLQQSQRLNEAGQALLAAAMAVLAAKSGRQVTEAFLRWQDTGSPTFVPAGADVLTGQRAAPEVSRPRLRRP
jgi:hypothetical protein